MLVSSPFPAELAWISPPPPPAKSPETLREEAAEIQATAERVLPEVFFP